MRGGGWEVYEWLHFKKKKFFFVLKKMGVCSSMAVLA